MGVGLKIKKLRELRNYTQTHMSNQLNMSLSGYSKIERDETEISLKRMYQIAEILETDINSILSFDGKQIFNIEQNNHDKGTQNAYVHTLKNENTDLYEKYIEQLKSENSFLKSLVLKEKGSVE